MTAERKRETRQTFLLGAIVVRAGLSKADRAFLLGGLLELAGIAPDSSEHRRLQDIGAEAFKAPGSHDRSGPAMETAEWR
ncbi:conjugal transfer protein TraD (plasmid) [Aquamicrobium terrae]